MSKFQLINSLFILCSLWGTRLCAQCPSANVFLKTQAQVDAFQTNYPTCHDVSNITIEIKDDGTDPITSLSALSGLQSFTAGSLRVINTGLSSFSGLDNITSIDGSLYLSGNTGIVNMTDFTNLSTVTTEIFIGSNTSLEDCSTFCDLRTVDNMNPAINIGGNKWGFPCANSSTFNTACGPLPIELSYFESEIVEDGILLSWETLSEKNNRGFAIEKSTNGRDWEEISWMDGHDTDSQANQYEYLDKAPSYKINYYRIKQVDYDGKYDYSPVVSEYYLRQQQTVEVYPNPAHDRVVIRVSTGLPAQSLVLYDATGQKVMMEKSKNWLNLANLPRGLYVIELTFDNENIFKRIIVE